MASTNGETMHTMHSSQIQKDVTDHVPQVVRNMTNFSSTIKLKKSIDKNGYEAARTTVSSDEESDGDFEGDDNGEENGTMFDIEDAYNRLNVKQKSHRNLIKLPNDKLMTGDAHEESDCRSQVHHACCYSLPILHPHGSLRIGWDCVIMVVLIYTCIEIPYSLAFGINLSLHNPFGVLALTIDCLLLFDVLLNFRTGYFDEFDQQMLVYDPRRIAWRYFSTWFFLDFFTSIPFEFLIPDDSAGNFPSLIKVLRIFRMIRLLKLLRFFRMLKTFNLIISAMMTRSMLMIAKLFKLLCLMTLSAHFFACFWFYIGRHSYETQGAGNSWLYPDASDPSSGYLILDESVTNVERYVTSFYFAVVTLYTTGYGDITAHSIDEKLCVSVGILIGTCFFAYFIGAVGSLIADGDRVKSAQVQKIEEAQAFCSSKKLPSPVAHALMSHAKYHWKRNFVFDEMDVIQSLPGYLRRDVGNCLSDKYFSGCELFQDLSPYIRGLIALRLRSVSCNANYELFHAHQYGKELFIQRTGCSYLLDQNEKLHQVTRGGVVGYFSLLNPVRATTLRCASWCEYYALDRDEIQDILRSNFPRAWRPLWNKIKARIKSLQERGIATINTEVKRDRDVKFATPAKANENFLYETAPLQQSSVDIEMGVADPSPHRHRLPTLSDRTTANELPQLQPAGSSGRPTLKMSDSNRSRMVLQAAKTAKVSTDRKVKKVLNISDSEMRDDKVLQKPPLSYFKRQSAYKLRWEKKLKSKMRRRRHKRAFKGVEEIIPIFNNNKPISTKASNHFQNIIDEESDDAASKPTGPQSSEPPLDTGEHKVEEWEHGHDNDNDNDDHDDDVELANQSSEEQYEGNTESEEWGDDSDLDGDASPTTRKKRGVDVTGSRPGGGFKGMKKVKMNKNMRGIKPMRPKVQQRRQKKVRSKEKSATPLSHSIRSMPRQSESPRLRQSEGDLQSAAAISTVATNRDQPSVKTEHGDKQQQSREQKLKALCTLLPFTDVTEHNEENVKKKGAQT